MSAHVTIRPAGNEDIPAILPIADGAFGKDYVTAAQLEIYITHTNKIVFLVAEADETIAGFCISAIADKNELEHYVKGLNALFNEAGKTGIIKTIAIDDSFKGRGIGTLLVQLSMDILRSKYDIHRFCCIGWKDSNGVVNIKNTLERLGFSTAGEIPDYWMTDSIQNNYSCPVCGHPCRCAAVIFNRDSID